MEEKRRRGIRNIFMKSCVSPATFCGSGAGTKWVDRELLVFNQGYNLMSVTEGRGAEEEARGGVESVCAIKYKLDKEKSESITTVIHNE